MKSISIEKAKHNAKAQSLDKQNKDVAFYIILCNRTGNYYADTNALLRTWEQLIGWYENGIYADEN